MSGEWTYLFIIEGGTSRYYNISNYEGCLSFDINIPIDEFTERMQEIAPDGNVKVTLIQYKEAKFFLKEEREPNPVMNYKYLVKFDGAGGTGYGGMEYFYANEDIENSIIIYPMDNFDGNVGYYLQHKRYPRIPVEGGETIVLPIQDYI